MGANMRMSVIIMVLMFASPIYAGTECQQPVMIVNIANLACVDENTGKIIHKDYRGNYKLDVYSDDENNNWYRGDFYGLDDD